MGAVSKALAMLLHPSELLPLYRMYNEVQRVMALTQGSEDLQFCYDMLNNVSRSFAVVIQQLPECLRDPICVFYLVLRALDTVEDDMALPEARKLPLLHAFHEHIADPQFSMSDCGEKHCKKLLENYPRVTRVFLGLDAASRAVIQDITKRMGEGMAEYIKKDVVTVADYDQYCYYVAGLVGVGLCHLFAASGCEDKRFAGGMDGLAVDMGLFLQKTNIIRDYLEDILEEPAPRMFWPKEVWGNYAQELAEFKDAENRPAAIWCLNHMVHDAMRHAPRCLEYMRSLRHPQVFAFCAIPQIMAIATLAMCYNNGAVFEGVVKMRRGQTAVVFDQLRGMGSLYQQFYGWGSVLMEKVQACARTGDDPTAKQLLARVHETLEACQKGADAHNVPLRRAPRDPRWLTLVMTICYLLYALNAAALREYFGVPDTALSPVLDKVQPAVGVIMLVFSLLSTLMAR